MYRCEICHSISKPGQPKLIHNLYKPRVVKQAWHRRFHGPSGKFRMEQEVQSIPPQIDREIPVCRSCKSDLDAGITYAHLYEAYREVRCLGKPTVLRPMVNEPVDIGEPVRESKDP